MKPIIERTSRGALLGLAILPLAAIASGAHAETRIKVSDLDLATAKGAAVYEQRASKAERAFCRGKISLSAQAACRAAVKTELAAEGERLRQARDRRRVGRHIPAVSSTTASRPITRQISAMRRP